MPDELKQSTKNVTNETNYIINNLDKQITNIELRQQEIQNYIALIDNNISFLTNLINTEREISKARSYRNALTKNMELLVKLYDSYKEYEKVKYKYNKEIDDVSQRKTKMIEIDIPLTDFRVQNTNDTDFISVFESINKLIKSNQNKIYDDNLLNNEGSKELLSDKKYDL